MFLVVCTSLSIYFFGLLSFDDLIIHTQKVIVNTFCSYFYYFSIYIAPKIFFQNFQTFYLPRFRAILNRNNLRPQQIRIFFLVADNNEQAFPTFL